MRWPLSLVIWKKTLTKYQLIFRHLFHCKQLNVSCVPPGSYTRQTSVFMSRSICLPALYVITKKDLAEKGVVNTVTYLVICFAVSCLLIQFLGYSYIVVIYYMPSHATLFTNLWTLYDFRNLELSLLFWLPSSILGVENSTAAFWPSAKLSIWVGTTWELG